MIIVNQDKKAAYFFSNTDQISVHGKNISISRVSAKDEAFGWIVGSYETEERAQEVFNQILESFIDKIILPEN